MLAFLAAQDDTRPIVWMSFDETSVACAPSTQSGCVVSTQHWRSRRSYVSGPHRKIKKERRRGSYTYCATICSNTTVQTVLPHFLIAKRTAISNKMMRAFHALPTTRLQLLRQKTAWVTAETMIAILKELKKALASFKEYRFILMLDCASPHLPKKVLQAARRQGVQLLFVPSSATALVQVADVSAFGPFKAYLRKKYQELCSSSVDGQPEALAWLFELGQAPRKFFASRSWQKGFASIGASQNCSDLHSTLFRFMQNPQEFPGPVKPSRSQVLKIWPSRRKMDYAYASIFR